MNPDVLTFGIEEEFFVVDRHGHLSQAGDDVVDAAEAAADDHGALQHELTRSQAEAATDVCRTHGEALRQLRDLRGGLAAAARRRGCRLLPAGAPLLSEVDPPSITPNPRYERMAEHFGATARTSLTCGCHVHVAIPGKEQGIRVLGWVRPWLPALLTLTANSAIADGYDTGYSSWRYQQWSRWPSAGPPPRFASLDEYESIVDGWLRAGSILDRGMIYWDVRLSEKQPTLEFRIADVAATPEEAVLLGVLARGLVATALADDGAAAGAVERSPARPALAGIAGRRHRLLPTPADRGPGTGEGSARRAGRTDGSRTGSGGRPGVRPGRHGAAGGRRRRRRPAAAGLRRTPARRRRRRPAHRQRLEPGRLEFVEQFQRADGRAGAAGVDDEVHPGGFGVPVRPHEHPQARGAEEPDFAEVHPQDAGPGPHVLGQGRFEFGGGAEIDLAGHLHDDRVGRLPPDVASQVAVGRGAGRR